MSGRGVPAYLNNRLSAYLLFGFGFFFGVLGRVLGFFAYHFLAGLGLDLGLEFFHASGGVDQFLLAGVKRMALAAKLGFDLGQSRAGGHSETASTSDLGIFVILGMNIVFHKKAEVEN